MDDDYDIFEQHLDGSVLWIVCVHGIEKGSRQVGRIEPKDYARVLRNRPLH